LVKEVISFDSLSMISPHHFKRVKISSVALIKMVMHAKKGGDIEVMGLMQGKVRGGKYHIIYD
jgi:COP9 signalosome complex subunit 5